MPSRPALLILLAPLALAACGRPDASGLYLSKADRGITLVQLAQTRDGAVSGRLERLSIGPDGAVVDQSTPLAGAATGRALTLGPGASGTFSHDGLELSGPGAAVSVRRTNLKDYQAAVARLEGVAAAERRRAGDVQAQQAAAAVQAAPLADAADKAGRLAAATADLLKAAADLDAGVAAAPDFAAQSAQATAQVTRLAQAAAGQSGRDRSQTAAQANAAIVGASQIEVARSRYAAGLNPIIRRAAPLASEVQQFCGGAEAATLAKACAAAAAAATGFQSAQVRAFTVFNGAKHAIQDDLNRQNALAQKLGG